MKNVQLSLFHAAASSVTLGLLAIMLFLGTGITNTHAEPVDGVSLSAALLVSERDKPDEVPDYGDDPHNAILSVINYFLTFLAIIAIAFIIYGGYLMVMAGGDEENVEKGKKILIWAIVGMILVITSYTIVRIITDLALFEA